MLLFLHGFLGQKEDWDPLLSYLSSSSEIKAIDLPYRATDIALAVKEIAPKAKIVVGYSAGGRIALELKARFPNDYGKIIALSAHPGLKTEQEKIARLKIDEQWIEMLKKGPFAEFLEKWYGQDLFQSLKNSPHYDEILKRRKMQNPEDLAHFLTHFSIAKKQAPQISPETIFIHGKLDLKYGKLYRTLVPIEKIFTIENAGHAAHIENPQGSASVIQGAIDEHY